MSTVPRPGSEPQPASDAPDHVRWTLATRAVATGRPPHRPGAPVNPPVVLSSTYIASADPGDRQYDRFGNATWEAFEQALGALEEGCARVWASGMAAIAGTLDLLPVGGTVVMPRACYNGTSRLADTLQATGRLQVRRVDIADTDATLSACRGADLLWIESPSNPLLEVVDLPALVDGAHRHGAVVAADNTFATPVLLQPLRFGVDVVVHSVSKYLAGHSDVLLGATVSTDPAITTRLHEYRSLNGATPGAWECWLALRGVRTLHLRVERANATAVELARRLTTHRAVSRVRHPSLPGDPGHARATAQLRGYGAIVCLEFHDGPRAADRLVDAVRLWTPATSLGAVESTLERRRRITSESPLVPESLVRLSVGIEDVEDLYRDLEAALDSL